MVVTLLHTLLPRTKMIVPVATGEDTPVIPGITIAAKDIIATEADPWTAAGRDGGSPGKKGEESEGCLFPCWVEKALVKGHVWHKVLNKAQLS